MSRAELDVWLIDVRVAAPLQRQLLAALDDAEREHADRFVRPGDALRYRVAHGSLRTILGTRAGIAPPDVRFSFGEHGKPLLRGGPHFSLSHSGALAIVAVAEDRDVGVDVEKLRPVASAEALARFYFAPAEAQRIAAQPQSGRDLLFMRSWTAMEAIAKAEGTGLVEGLRDFELRDSGAGSARGRIPGWPAAPEWSVRWLELGPEHIGAVATRGSQIALRTHRFP